MGFLTPKAATIPPPTDIGDFPTLINDIFQTSTKTVVDASGNKRVIIEDTKSPEEKSRIQALQLGVDSAMNAINRLNQYEIAANDPAFQSYVKAFTSIKERDLAESFETASEGMEESLAKAGQANSTTAQKARQAVLRQRTTAEQDLRDKGYLVAEDLRAAQVNRATNVLDINNQLLQQDKQNALSGLSAGQGIGSQIFQGQIGQARAQDQVNMFNAKAKQASQQAKFANIKTLTGIGAEMGMAAATGGSSLAFTQGASLKGGS